VLDTAAPSPHDIAEPGKEAAPASQRRITVRGRSCIVLRSQAGGASARR
jgi:hypothetical protein